MITVSGAIRLIFAFCLLSDHADGRFRLPSNLSRDERGNHHLFKGFADAGYAIFAKEPNVLTRGDCLEYGFLWLNLAGHDSVRGIQASDFSSVSMRESIGFFDVSDAEWEYKKKMHNSQMMRQVSQHSFAHGRYFYQANWQPSFHCQHMQWLESIRDGGKWLCDPHKIAGREECLVLSFGSKDIFDFEESILQLNSDCEIHSFDHTIPNATNNKPAAVTFHSIGLGRRDQGPIRTFSSVLKMLGLEGRIIDVLKIDCEGCEFNVWPHVVAAPVRQVLMEVHFNKGHRAVGSERQSSTTERTGTSARGRAVRYRPSSQPLPAAAQPTSPYDICHVVPLPRVGAASANRLSESIVVLWSMVKARQVYAGSGFGNVSLLLLVEHPDLALGAEHPILAQASAYLEGVTIIGIDRRSAAALATEQQRRTGLLERRFVTVLRDVLAEARRALPDAKAYVYSNPDISLFPRFYLSLLELGTLTAASICRIDVGCKDGCPEEVQQALSGHVPPGEGPKEAILRFAATQPQNHLGHDAFYIPAWQIDCALAQMSAVFLGFPPVGAHLMRALEVCAGQCAGGRAVYVRGSASTFHLGYDAEGVWQERTTENRLMRSINSAQHGQAPPQHPAAPKCPAP